jgi:hypothetical protein
LQPVPVVPLQGTGGRRLTRTIGARVLPPAPKEENGRQGRGGRTPSVAGLRTRQRRAIANAPAQKAAPAFFSQLSVLSRQTSASGEAMQGRSFGVPKDIFGLINAEPPAYS